MDGNSYSFAAIRGMQARTAYYTVMMPLQQVHTLFAEEDDLPADLRAQRVLSKARVPQIASYLANNWEDYILSSLCASVDGEMSFVPAGETPALRNVGTLNISMTARMLLNDGQHRRAAIKEALKIRPELAVETLSVVMFADRGLERSQQMFADLNKNAVRPSGSLSVLFDHRDPLASLSSGLLEAVPFFQSFIELEKTSLSNRQTKLYTLSSLNQANQCLGGRSADRFDDKTADIVTAYWTLVAGAIKEWRQLEAATKTCAELRRETVLAHGVMLQSLGMFGARLISARPKSWRKDVKELSEVDWSRRNSELWEGRVMYNRKISGQRGAVILGANALCNRIGLALDEVGQTAEDVYIEKRTQKEAA